MNEFITKSSLFKNISHDDAQKLLSCLMPRTAFYDEGNIIFAQGDIISEIGFIFEGSVQIVNEDYWGERTIISHLKQGDFFGEVYAAFGKRAMDNTVYAAEKCKIVFIPIDKIMSPCSVTCIAHGSLIANLVKELAQKNLMLMQKISFLSKRSTRDKVLAFLSKQAEKSSSGYFTIPFSRQEMADFLCVDRSALSKELGKMKKEKILDFDKNNFRLL